MEYVVFDLEWNQPENKKRTIKYPIRLSGEIIQIGAVKLNENLEIIDTFDTYVKPVFYTKMNKKVSELTGITEKDLAKGLSFEKSATEFKAWCDDATLISWGPDEEQDVFMLIENNKNFYYDIIINLD